ncbi:UDP-N-acetylglucosamine transferase subunit ALG13 homolog [Ceratitis capitata]|uniref:UDP-N-acetylglucosamine transferase subunit ALG13 n=1 Tax=Ceratitis capitata TaxID=7213 RepID=W8C9I6_CERCA|nr:UDP-N-acetylglucosamine transferase subunit ALG13 homolog [Ceratitis capitata]CAD6993061.1 unnamed protein product [Ceratitis capitata]
MEWRMIYVTVGTTRFEDLVKAIVSDPILRILKQRGCRKLVIQYGHGRPVKNTGRILEEYGITLEQYDFKLETPRSDMVLANLVIGHAGAGTCMDILNHNRAGIIVINDSLMDNHQLELAQQLSEEGYFYYCNVEGLADTLQQANLSFLKPYDKSNNMHRFVRCMNELMTP